MSGAAGDGHGAALLLHERRANATALNVLLGSLEVCPEAAGLEIRIGRGREELAAAIAAHAAAGRRVLVAWSFYSPDFLGCARELRWVRKRAPLPGVLHVAGGPHASAEPRQTLEAGFDLVALGEGERTIRDLARALLAGREPREVEGVGFLSGGRYQHHGSGERIELDDFPPFAAAHRRLNPIEITRGCVHACNFCQTPFLFKARFRHRSVENVAFWIQTMVSSGCDYVRFLSPTALSYGSDGKRPRLDRVEELLARARGILGSRGRLFFGTFPSEVRPEHVTAEALAILARHVSNRNLVIGGQSGSDRVLAASRRGHDREAIVEAVRRCVEARFLPNVDLILGLPGEEPSDVEATLDLARALVELGARIHAHTFMPLPGTPTKDAPPGRISESTRQRLERLLARGAVYGQWKQQIATARRLARIRGRGAAALPARISATHG